MDKFIAVHNVDGESIFVNVRYIFKMEEGNDDANAVIHLAIPFKYSGENNFYHEVLPVTETVQQIMNLIEG